MLARQKNSEARAAGIVVRAQGRRRCKVLGRASRVPPFGFQKTDEFPNGVFIVPSSHLFSKQMMCRTLRVRGEAKLIVRSTTNSVTP